MNVRSVHELDAIILDHRIGQHVARDLVDLLARLFGSGGGGQVDVEKFPLAHARDGGVPQSVQCPADRLTLRIEHGGLEGNKYASLHTPTLLDFARSPSRIPTLADRWSILI